MTDLENTLEAATHGDAKAAAELIPLMYRNLRQLANQKLAHERPGQTLSATALVNEAFLRLTKNGDHQQWNSKRHFFAAAAEAMRRILIESAKRKASLRRGGRHQRVALESFTPEFEVGTATRKLEILELDRLLHMLASERPEAAELVQLRYFTGLTMADAAKIMNVSERTAHRYWKYAKGWLFHQMQVQ